MSVLAGIVNYFDNGNSADLTTLKGLVGNDGLYADAMPGAPDRPYVLAVELATTLTDQTKSSKHNRILNVTVGFMVFGSTRTQVESVLDAIEEVFIGDDLVSGGFTMTGRTLISTMFDGRQSLLAADGWQGEVDIVFKIARADN